MGIEAPFSIETLEDRLLNRLDKKQESVQELSRWLIKHHENADVIVHTWLKCLRQVSSSSKKKSLIYLANDVLQNGIKKNTSYTNHFLPKLPIAFASFGICDQRLLKSLMNVLLVWETRAIFPIEYVKALRNALFAEQRKHLEQCIQEQTSTSKLNESSLLEETTYQIDPDGDGGGESAEIDETIETVGGGELEANLDSARELNASLSRQSRQSKKRKKERRGSSGGGSSGKKRKRSKRRRVTHEELGPRPLAKIDLQKLDNDVMQLTEQAASTDSATREKLAQLPNEVQDEQIMDALTDASTLELLYELVSRATSMIQNYTRRVKEEQHFRHALLATLKVAKKEQTEIFKYERKELINNRRAIEVFSEILDNLEEN